MKCPMGAHLLHMDIKMPDANGYEITESIKRITNDKYVPVIFVTGNTKDVALEKCLDSGGDDFIIKPIKEKILRAKVGSLLRIKKMHDELHNKKELLSKDSEVQKKDLNDADKIIYNIHKPLFHNPGNLDWAFEPQNILSGDIICSARGPVGNHVILLGDNTGHGLPAAIGSMIAYDIFYAMVGKGCKTQIIIDEINKKLLKLLPTDRFLAACFIDIDYDNNVMNVWNAGLPSLIKFNRNETTIGEVPSMHMPLGIAPIDSNEFLPIRFEIKQGDHFYLYTDGLTEEFNEECEMFGDQRLLESIKSSKDSESRVDSILNKVIDFRGSSAQSDDILLLEIIYDNSLIKCKQNKKNKHKEIAPMDWHLSFDLQFEIIRNLDPLPTITQTIVDIQGFGEHRERIFLILTEMYSNSIEHGILKLESSIKEEVDGFKKYYELRQSRLNKLANGHLAIDINHKAEDTKGVLSITITDSGDGFDYSKLTNELNRNKHGRGVHLLNNLCNHCEYSNDGRTLEVEYQWELPMDSNKILN